MNIEIISEILKGSGSEELLGFFQEKIDALEKEKDKRLNKILIEPNPPTEELVALKVIARTHNEVRKILEELLGMRDYKKVEQKESDESFGL